jgi:hypothetical protein
MHDHLTTQSIDNWKKKLIYAKQVDDPQKCFDKKTLMHSVCFLHIPHFLLTNALINH